MLFSLPNVLVPSAAVCNTFINVIAATCHHTAGYHIGLFITAYHHRPSSRRNVITAAWHHGMPLCQTVPARYVASPLQRTVTAISTSLQPHAMAPCHAARHNGLRIEQLPLGLKQASSSTFIHSEHLH